MKSHPGRRWAYIGAGVGGAATVAANTAHSFVPPVGKPSTWTPEPGAVIAAAFWPIALLVSVEILVRVPWPDGRWFAGLRFIGVGLVATVAAVVSYLHLSGLLDHYDEDPLTVLIGPLAIDGLLLMASAALLATADGVGYQSGAIEAPIVEAIPVDPQSLAESTPTDRPPIEGPTDRVDPPIDRPQPIEAIEGRSTPTATPIDRGQLTPTAIRSMGQLRTELELAVEANSVDPNSAESIRKVLGVGLQRARALRDERAAKPPAADDEEESRSG